MSIRRLSDDDNIYELPDGKVVLYMYQLGVDLILHRDGSFTTDPHVHVLARDKRRVSRPILLR